MTQEFTFRSRLSQLVGDVVVCKHKRFEMILIDKRCYGKAELERNIDALAVPSQNYE